MLDRAIIGLILVGVLAGGAVWGYKHIKDQGKQEVVAADNKASVVALDKRNDEITAAKAKHDEETKQLKRGYANEIDTIHAAYTKSDRLRFREGACQRLAPDTQANSASGSNDGNAETWGFSPEVESGIKQLGQEIEEKFAACRVAQEFIRKNGMAP